MIQNPTQGGCFGSCLAFFDNKKQTHSALESRRIRLFLMYGVLPFHLLDILFEFAAGTHDLMTAAVAAELKICTDAQNRPLAVAAGVGFFHGQHIANLNIHGHFNPLL